MASSVLQNVKEEVTCPICLELMTEPVSTDCGHTFCKLCITSNYESTKHEQGVGNCPVCRVTYHIENLRPSRHVANIVERLREVTLTPQADQCDLHGEKLVLFCWQDGKVLCWLCERSQVHRGHHTLLMEEAAQEYRNQIQGERESVRAAFQQMRATLDSEERTHLQKLQTEEQGVLNGLAESEKELAQQAWEVRELISDVRHRLQGSTVAMLQESSSGPCACQDVKNTMERCQLFTVKRPRTFPKNHRIMFQAPDLKNILQSQQAPVVLTPSSYSNISVHPPIPHKQFIFGRNQVKQRSRLLPPPPPGGSLF
ncbi:PREDICTED: tripartite motif-containing protein 5-like isoform X3 [Chinchilla lanigera]|uniref:tripartite motif-containing protein 5-like isoform X3 n=1 Tax=Chinchilla lanigera TaxID=34839 RepID=UPI00069759AD|nr:PREDICTED: tripartite motif-containing protein 5-like isoform X3 [Chinchilla lanigera]